jgi:LCP family protein required for cell wall assembly
MGTMEDFPKLKKINDLPEFVPPDAAKKKKKKRGKFFVLKVISVFVILVAITGSIFSYKVLSVSNDVFVQFDDEKSSFFSNIGKLLLADNKKLLGQEEGRTNILLLGMGGEGHTGAELTDTIMLASIQYDDDGNRNVSLVSIPRDLYVEYEKGYNSKINSVYSIGERNGENQGALLISQVVSKISGVPIHYYVRVDFNGFKKVVDALGGIDVDVERGFIDRQYPTYNFGWQTVEFEKGLQYMDGEKALQYSRSRHGVVTDGEGFEGSDFARAERQQRVLEAVKDKAFAVDTVINPKKVNDLLGAVGDHARTNVQPWEMMLLLEIARDINKDQIINIVLEHSEDGLLMSSKSNAGAYILLPRAGDYSEIKETIQNIFDTEAETNQELLDPEIAILNGTAIPGLAAKTKLNLSSKGYSVTDTDNAARSDYDQTIIYVVPDEESAELNAHNKKIASQLRDQLDSARIEEVTYSDNLSANTLDDSTDIIIILGKNAS